VNEIVTARLVLRRACPDDLDAMHGILSEPRAMRYWSTAPHANLDQTREWLDGMIDGAPPESDDFIITLEGQVIGKAGCWRLPQIGFILHPDCWGKGLAREAVAAVIERLFVEHGLAEITADVDPRNQSSLGLLERLGFRETSRAARTWHVGDEWCDSVYLALNREDWRHP
jgi:[ribosomal protein S5]-alanine N-acetyltransferase